MFNMKPKYLLSFILILQFAFNSQAINLKGDVSGVWKIENSPVKINGDIVIPEGKTLTIDAGVIVEFQGDFIFRVDGVIQVNGTKTDSVRFTSPKGITWKGFSFVVPYNSTANHFKYAIIEKAKKLEGGGVYVNGPVNLIIENSVIQNCNGDSGGGIKIVGDIFESVLVRNCIFRRNQAGFWGGGGIYLDMVNSIFEGCLIHNNTSLERGAGIYFIGHGFSPRIVNCTICDNKNASDFYKSVIIGSDAIFENTIIYNNIPKGILVESDFYKPEFRFCNFEEPLQITNDKKFLNFHGVIENCLINVAPEFVDRAKSDYRLKKSHNVNNGNPGFNQVGFNTDISGAPRIYEELNSRIDIGAFEYQYQLNNRTPQISSKKEYILPFNTSSKINLEFYDADSLNTHQIKAFSKNNLVDLEVNQPDKYVFTLTFYPKNSKIISEWVYIQIDDKTGAANAVLNDSILIHFSDQFKGEINNYVEFKDTVKVTGDILVGKEGKLKILPGTFVQFQGDYEINVFGEIDMNGTSTQTIVFNGIDTAYYYYKEGSIKYTRKKGWGGIILHAVNNQSVSHVDFRNTVEGCFKLYDSKNAKFSNCGFYNCHAIWEGNGGIYLENSEAKVDSCFFIYGTTGTDAVGAYISAKNSKINVSNSEFHENIRYNDFYWDFCGVSAIESELFINNCQFLNSRFAYVIEIIAGTNSIIENSLFQNNTAMYITEVFSDYCLIRNNIFINNSGLCILSRMTVIDVVNNLIAYNEHSCNCSNTYAFVDIRDAGVGDSASVLSNTIYGNITDASFGGGVYFSYANATAYDNIIWNNWPHEIGWYNGEGVDPELFPPKIYNNVIKGGYSQNGNFDFDPNFEFKNTLDFTLNEKSLCIDKGIADTLGLLYEKDLANKLRINPGTNKLDIGAYEFYETTGIKNVEADNEIQVFPNPANSFVNILSSKNKTIDEVRIFSVDGRLLRNESTGNNQSAIYIGDLNQGTYIIQVLIDGFIRNQKFIKK